MNNALELTGQGSTVVQTIGHESQALVEQESRRAMAEVEAAILLAKRFPRDIKHAVDRIMTACQRPGLAEAAIYTYSRGGTNITGPSIRLAEVLAQQWQNIQFGIRELDQRNGLSTVEAFCWDVESNTRQVKVFQVRHVRYTKKGSYALDDPRDIYEVTANQGARRLRSCILGIIPGDIVEQAVTECERTMKAKCDTGPESIKKLVTAFEAVGVKKEQIEKRIQRRIDVITAAQIIGLRKIYNSIRDGMGVVAEWFEIDEPDANATKPKTGVEGAKELLKGATIVHDIPTAMVPAGSVVEKIQQDINRKPTTSAKPSTAVGMSDVIAAASERGWTSQDINKAIQNNFSVEKLKNLTEDQRSDFIAIIRKGDDDD